MIRDSVTYGFGDTLNVVTEDLTVTLGTTPRIAGTGISFLRSRATTQISLQLFLCRAVAK